MTLPPSFGPSKKLRVCCMHVFGFFQKSRHARQGAADYTAALPKRVVCMRHYSRNAHSSRRPHPHVFMTNFDK